MESQENHSAPWRHGRLTVSENGRFLQHADGTPFFWLADTAWLLFARSTAEEAADYLEDRRKKGFNVVQVMVIHSMPACNAFGCEPFEGGNFRRPCAGGPDGYWEHIDRVFSIAEEKGVYIAAVPVWGSIVGSGALDTAAAAEYGAFLGRRYGKRPNVIWINGGDTHGDRHTDVWDTLGGPNGRATPAPMSPLQP